MKYQKAAGLESTIKYLNSLNYYQLSRWLALFEGVNLIAEAADDKKLHFKTINIKPAALLKYVDGTCDKICERLTTKQD